MSTTSANPCGACTLCCTLLGVPEIQKPPCTECKHVKRGVGCSIHETRPQGCRDFECIWLASQLGRHNLPKMPSSWRPDRCGVVFSMSGPTPTQPDRVVAYVDPRTPNAWRTEPARNFLQTVIQRLEVIVVCGDKRSIISKP